MATITKVDLTIDSVTVKISGFSQDISYAHIDLRKDGAQTSTETQVSYDVASGFETTFYNLERGGQGYRIKAYLYDAAGTNLDQTNELTIHTGFEITIDANGGTGSFYDTAAYNSVYTLPSDGFWKYSSKLLGYSTSPDATAAQFNVGMGIRMYQNWNLYCVWQEVTYTLSYYNTSGSSTPWMQETFPYDANGPYITVTTDIPERTGYRFVNWEIFQGYGTSLGYVEPGGTIQVGNSNASAIAQWAALQRHTVTYNANGGYPTPATQTAYDYEDVIVSETIPTRSGYTASVWWAVDNAGGAPFGIAPGSSFNVQTFDWTLYAEWYKYEIAVVAADNVASVSKDVTGLPYIFYDGTTQITATVSCTLETEAGSTIEFDGWYDSNGQKVSSSQTYTFSDITAPITLIAKATKTAGSTFTISYLHGVHGSGENQTQQKTSGTAVTLKGAIFTREGYTQTGWSTVDGGAKSYALGGQYTQDADLTLYPFWSPNAIDPSKTYTVTYSPGLDGTGSEKTDTKVKDVPLSLEGALFTKNGYAQSAWATSAGGEAAYSLGGLYTENAEITLYPVWGAQQPLQPDIVTDGEWRVKDYMSQLRTPFTKLCRLRFLQPDGSTAFAIDNNPQSRRSGAFIQDGTITCNLQNGQRRTANVTLSNIDAEYDYNINNIWFGQQIAIDEGLVLSNGYEYYIQQGVFYIMEPQETLNPNLRTISLPLVDKWAYLDGSLFGRLEATYEVPVGTNIFQPVAAILQLDRGNGYMIDQVPPVFTSYYKGKTQALPDGTTANLTDSPYTLRVDSDDGTLADVCLGMAEMVNAWIGYDQTGALRVDPSQDDIIDTNKPVLWRFSQDEAQLIGATYTIKNSEVFNDYIVLGEKQDDNPQAAGRAQNLDPTSDTNFNIIGRKTYRETASGYYTTTQCRDLAEWKLKRATVLQKAVSISCIQMMHISENNLVEIVRTDKPGSPVERHLIQGYTRPLATNGTMTINAVSVADFPNATITSWPE